MAGPYQPDPALAAAVSSAAIQPSLVGLQWLILG